ncbi:YjjG family noncanonical pyrimidine nucleotidase [Mucilaginibacter sp.]|uniref:YjjG family noncanonical pyrimidine nucleotidase n=1 Tax=Mucilaginibacter sp. TaxID=1882438 RepID=UPI003B00529B
MPYQHIFFDLDHTIWDFDKNAEETLHELFLQHKLSGLGLASPNVFIETYTRNNHRLWAEYHLGKISKEALREARFKHTFLELGLDEAVIPTGFEEDYVQLSPQKLNLFPEAHEVLKYLSGKYSLYVISNGFKESTEMKIRLCNLGQYFKHIFISEVIGVNKPDPKIFEHALQTAGAQKHQSLMIGDSLEADVYGALDFGIDAIYFNPNKAEKPANVPAQIQHLNELMLFL